ncbi:MAG TPA: nitrilase-related carbon-nitrogen hydrolase [Thermoanaerobaculia bacterium]|nr:nitrilase-related carbon-nitrogen hydrolase [Thermoanaerobaculia bacterium]
MSERKTSLRVGLAQIDAKLGEVEPNLEHHLEWIERARAERVELLLFPELSLTGYRLLHLTPRVALQPERSAIINRLREAAPEMSIVVGCVEEDERGFLFNSALLLQNGRIAHTHRKLYLPTYGIFQEGRFFSQGSRLALPRVAEQPFGILICEDFWHSDPAERLVRAGAKLIALVSASPGRIGPGAMPPSQEAWESLTRASALLNTSWVLYCGRVGWEEGTFYTGGSHIVRPGGEVLARAPYLDEHLLVAEIDLREVDRLRWRLPILAAERADITGPD